MNFGIDKTLNICSICSDNISNNCDKQDCDPKIDIQDLKIEANKTLELYFSENNQIIPFQLK